MTAQGHLAIWSALLARCSVTEAKCSAVGEFRRWAYFYARSIGARVWAVAPDAGCQGSEWRCLRREERCIVLVWYVLRTQIGPPN